MTPREYGERYELKAFGKLLDSGPSALVKSTFSSVRTTIVEAMASVVMEAARFTSTASTLATVRLHGDELARRKWEAMYQARRRSMWGCATRVARLACVFVAAAMGPDPVSPDEAGTGVSGEDAALVAMMAAAGRSEGDEDAAAREWANGGRR